MGRFQRRPGQGIGAAWANFRDYDAPFLAKLRMAARNGWKRVSTGSNCCGNDGEPGC